MKEHFPTVALFLGFLLLGMGLTHLLSGPPEPAKLPAVMQTSGSLQTIADATYAQAGVVELRLRLVKLESRLDSLSRATGVRGGAQEQLDKLDWRLDMVESAMRGGGR